MRQGGMRGAWNGAKKEEVYWGTGNRPALAVRSGYRKWEAPAACRKARITNQTLLRGRKECGGLQVDHSIAGLSEPAPASRLIARPGSWRRRLDFHFRIHNILRPI